MPSERRDYRSAKYVPVGNKTSHVEVVHIRVLHIKALQIKVLSIKVLHVKAFLIKVFALRLLVRFTYVILFRQVILFPFSLPRSKVGNSNDIFKTNAASQRARMSARRFSLIKGAVWRPMEADSSYPIVMKGMPHLQSASCTMYP